MLQVKSWLSVTKETDDEESTVRNRLGIYHEQRPCCCLRSRCSKFDYYKGEADADNCQYHKLDGTQDVEAVSAQYVGSSYNGRQNAVGDHIYISGIQLIPQISKNPLRRAHFFYPRTLTLFHRFPGFSWQL